MIKKIQKNRVGLLESFLKWFVRFVCDTTIPSLTKLVLLPCSVLAITMRHLVMHAEEN